MNKNLILTSTKGMSKADWLAFRHRGIGASEVGVVLGLSQYKSSIELFYEKCDPQPKMQYENIAMFLGSEYEDIIARLWKHWEGSEESIIDNFRNGKYIRQCERVNAYIQNPKYPWLFVSLDRKINKYKGKNEGALEIKTIAGYEADKWQSGIPPSHLVQVQTQMLVCEFDYGELATQTDGRRFDVYSFTPNEQIQNGIIERTKSFWDKVLAARKLINERYQADANFNFRRVNEINAKLQTLEPEPDGSLAYEAYMKERYKESSEAGVILGKPEHYELAQKHLELGLQVKEIEEQMLLCTNTLKKAIGGMETLDFGSNGKVYWRGNPRKFFNKVKKV